MAPESVYGGRQIRGPGVVDRGAAVRRGTRWPGQRAIAASARYNRLENLSDAQRAPSARLGFSMLRRECAQSHCRRPGIFRPNLAKAAVRTTGACSSTRTRRSRAGESRVQPPDSLKADTGSIVDPTPYQQLRGKAPSKRTGACRRRVVAPVPCAPRVFST